MNENDALAVVDERMRRASLELRAAIEAAVADLPLSAGGAGDIPTDERGVARVIPLDGSRPTRPSPRRWAFAVAAAALIAVGVGAVIVLARDDSDQPPTSPPEQPLLVPDRLLPGWSPVSAMRSGAPTQSPITVSIYGPPEREDQLTGALVIIRRSDPEGLTTSSDTESIDVDGHPATITEEGDALTITIALDDRTMEVMTRGVSRDGMLRIAEAAVRGESIEPLLPNGLVKVGEGAIDLPDRPAAPTVSIVYRDDGGAKQVAISQRPGRASEVGLLGLLLTSYAGTDTTVRGQHATVMTPGGSGSDGNPVIVQWLEPPGLLVTVAATGLSDSELMELIEGLRPATAGEIDELIERYGEPLPSDDTLGDGSMEGADSDTLGDGAVVVAEGDRGRNHWRVSASDTLGSVDVVYEDDHGSFGFGASSGRRPNPQLEIHTRDRFDALGGAPVIGVAKPAISEVVVEAAGQTPLSLDLHRNARLTRRVVVGFVPRAYVGGVVVGRDSNGKELARVTLVPPPSDGEMDDADDDATVITDVDGGDGRISGGATAPDGG